MKNMEKSKIDLCEEHFRNLDDNLTLSAFKTTRDVSKQFLDERGIKHRPTSEKVIEEGIDYVELLNADSEALALVGNMINKGYEAQSSEKVILEAIVEFLNGYFEERYPEEIGNDGLEQDEETEQLEEHEIEYAQTYEEEER